MSDWGDRIVERVYHYLAKNLEAHYRYEVTSS